MDISSINSSSLSSILAQLGIDKVEGSDGEMPPPPPPGGPEGAGGPPPMGGPMAQLLGNPEELSEEQQEEMKAFGDKVREAMSNGDFDAEALAEEAPEFLKQAAEEKGVSLADTLTDMKGHFDSMRAVVGGRSGSGNPYASGLAQAQSSIMALLGQRQDEA